MTIGGDMTLEEYMIKRNGFARGSKKKKNPIAALTYQEADILKLNQKEGGFV